MPVDTSLTFGFFGGARGYKTFKVNKQEAGRQIAFQPAS